MDLSLTKNRWKKNWSFNSSYDVSLSGVVLYLFKSTIQPYMEYCCHAWAGVLNCYLDTLDKLQIWVCMNFGRKLTTSIERLVDHRNLASLILFYIYYFSRRSLELAELFPLTYSCVRSVGFSPRLHDLSVNITRCYKDVYTDNSFHRTARPCNSCLQNYFLWIMI